MKKEFLLIMFIMLFGLMSISSVSALDRDISIPRAFIDTDDYVIDQITVGSEILADIEKDANTGTYEISLDVCMSCYTESELLAKITNRETDIDGVASADGNKGFYLKHKTSRIAKDPTAFSGPNLDFDDFILGLDSFNLEQRMKQEIKEYWSTNSPDAVHVGFNNLNDQANGILAPIKISEYYVTDNIGQDSGGCAGGGFLTDPYVDHHDEDRAGIDSLGIVNDIAKTPLRNGLEVCDQLEQDTDSGSVVSILETNPSFTSLVVEPSVLTKYYLAFNQPPFGISKVSLNCGGTSPIGTPWQTWHPVDNALDQSYPVTEYFVAGSPRDPETDPFKTHSTLFYFGRITFDCPAGSTDVKFKVTLAPNHNFRGESVYDFTMDDSFFNTKTYDWDTSSFENYDNRIDFSSFGTSNLNQEFSIGDCVDFGSDDIDCEVDIGGSSGGTIWDVGDSEFPGLGGELNATGEAGSESIGGKIKDDLGWFISLSDARKKRALDKQLEGYEMIREVADSFLIFLIIPYNLLVTLSILLILFALIPLSINKLFKNLGRLLE